MNIAYMINNINFFYLPCDSIYGNHMAGFVSVRCSMKNAASLKKYLTENEVAYCSFEDSTKTTYVKFTNARVSSELLSSRSPDSINTTIEYRGCEILQSKRH